MAAIALPVLWRVAGAPLDRIGHVPNKVRGAEILRATLALQTPVPMMLTLGAGALIWFYPLATQRHADICSGAGIVGRLAEVRRRIGNLAHARGGLVTAE